MTTKLILEDLINLANDIDQRLHGKKENSSLFEHLNEEVEELKEKLEEKEKFEQLKEFGDVLFCLISIAKTNDLDISHALTLTLTKLQERIKFGING